MIVSSYPIREDRRTWWNTCPADGKTLACIHRFSTWILWSHIQVGTSKLQSPVSWHCSPSICYSWLLHWPNSSNFNVTEADPKINRFEPYSNDGTSLYRISIVLRVPHYYQAISSELSYLIGVLTSSSRVSRLAHIRVTSERSRWLLPEVPVLRSNEFCLLIISYRKGERLMMASALETRSGAKKFC